MATVMTMKQSRQYKGDPGLELGPCSSAAQAATAVAACSQPQQELHGQAGTGTTHVRWCPWSLDDTGLRLPTPNPGSGWEGALRVLSIRDLAPSVQERYQKQRKKHKHAPVPFPSLLNLLLWLVSSVFSVGSIWCHYSSAIFNYPVTSLSPSPKAFLCVNDLARLSNQIFKGTSFFLL